MADSDGEDEKFVKNVIHELSAFEVEGKQTSAVREDTKPVESPRETHGNNEMSSEGTEPPKPPTRVIKLSRPLNPYGSSSRTSLPSAVSSAPSSVSSPAPGQTAGSGPGAPGSRLAAMQRPGSPMHKFLQRSKSPALAAAAARLGQQNSQDAPPAPAPVPGNAETEPATMSAPPNPSNNESSESVPTPTAASSSLRSTMPPRIQSSGLTSSILLRRPQSPLRHSRTSQLNKQLSDTSDDGPASPRSPPSEGAGEGRLPSGNLPSTAPSDDAQAAEKEAIRNKLRANSFRLKDLLTKRPFVKPRDQQGENEGREENGTGTDQSADSSDGQAGAVAEVGRPRDRTRWRVEGSAASTTSSSRSRLSEKASSILSSRTSYARTRHARESAEQLQDKSGPDNNDTSGSVRNNVHEQGSMEDASADAAPVNSRDSSNSENQNPRNSQELDMQRLPRQDNVTGNVTVGATLLRSPRTRGVSVDSCVPSSAETIHDHTHAMGDNSTNSAKHDKEFADKRSKTLSDLEKDAEVNLVFNSETIGQEEQYPDTELSHDSRQSDMSKSMQVGSYQPHTRSSRRGHASSEPATPITEQHPLANSQSFEKSLDADFMNQSASLKRSFAVTDLDKAMYERDKQKLDSLFKGASQDAGEGEGEGEASQEQHADREQQRTPGVAHGQRRRRHSSKQEETDLDDRPSTHRALSTPGPSTPAATQSPQLPPRLPRTSVSDEPQAPGSPAPHPHLIQAQGQAQPQPGPATPPVNPVAPMVYKPNVNLEDAVKWPMDIPGKLDFKTMEVFEGQMLLNWLTSSVDKSHYLRLVMTKHDMNVIACQICTCLVAAGVMKQLESKDIETVFKTDCMYYWTHTQHQASPHTPQDVNRLTTPMWPPTFEDADTTKPGLKYTEAEHQAAMVKLRHEYNEEVDKLQTEQGGVLDRARHEYEQRLQQAMERIVLLQKEVEKYRCLAGIEKLTQDALSDADAARLEAGYQPDGQPQTNGFATPGGVSQYPHGPASNLTPEALAAQASPRQLFPGQLDDQAESETSRSETSSISEADSASSAPPPPPPPPPGAPPPPAPPPPPAFGVHRSMSLKPVVSPASPMKPLFWQRLQLLQLKTPKNKEYHERKLVWEEIQEVNVDERELEDLFAKSSVEPSRRFFNRPKSKSKQPAKVISPKRSQTVGILLSSLRVEMSDIEYAILNFDTSLIGEEKLRHIYENRGDSDEMKKLKEFVKKHPDTPLDKPDQFLYDLSLVPDYSERIFCFIFREAFQDSISVIDKKMTNLKMTCQTLIGSQSLKRILGLVLALGNYMNGGNKQRGQADGFGIEILPKLKDVRSKDNASSLLHYTVHQYVKQFERGDAGTERVKLPLPDPSDMKDACLVHFDELDKELKRIKKDFEAAEERANKVMSSAKEHHHLQPFKDIMTHFFERGQHEFREQEENIMEGKKIFEEAVLVFCVKPKSGDKEVTPEYFFSTWCTFCQDFKDIWKREQQRVVKMKIKENELRVKKMQQSLAKKPVRTRTRKPGGLKDRLAKQGLLES